MPDRLDRHAARRRLRDRRRDRRPGHDATARLDVAVPAEAAASTRRITVTATGGDAEDVLPISIRVDAEAAGDITVDTPNPVLTGPPTARSRSRSPSTTTRRGPDGLGDSERPDQPDGPSRPSSPARSRPRRRSSRPAATANINVTARAAGRSARRPVRDPGRGTAGAQKSIPGARRRDHRHLALTLDTPNDLLSARGGPARRRPRSSSSRTPEPRRSRTSRSRRRRRRTGRSRSNRRRRRPGRCRGHRHGDDHPDG